MAVLKPLYALPSRTRPPPYEIALEANNKIWRLAFSTLEDTFLFQQGVTGFKVADHYFQYVPRPTANPCYQSLPFSDRFRPDMTIRFVTKKRGLVNFEEASAQIWIHDRLAGSLVPDNSDSVSSSDTSPSPTPARLPTVPSSSSDQPHSIPAQTSFGTSPGQDSSGLRSWMRRIWRKAPSPDRDRIASVSSATTAPTMQSRPTSTSDTMVTVSSSDGLKSAPVHIQPRKPILVLFTRDPETKHCAIDVVSIDDDLKPSRQGQSQTISILEPKGNLEARRLYSPTGQWDLLCLYADCGHARKGCTAEAWGGLGRVSFLFPDVEARFRFSGMFCSCQRRTIGQEKECMEKGHLGQLGKAAVYYRKRMISYDLKRNRMVQKVTYQSME